MNFYTKGGALLVLAAFPNKKIERGPVYGGKTLSETNMKTTTSTMANTWAYNIYNMLLSTEEKPMDSTLQEETTTIEVEDGVRSSMDKDYVIRVLNGNGEDEFEDEIISRRRERNKLVSRWIFFGVALGSVMAMVPSVTIASNRSDPFQNPDSSFPYESNTGKGEDGAPTDWYFEEARPFSLLDPVEDLNLYNFQRPFQTSPSSRLDPLRAQATESSSMGKPIPLPTNAWYQNLLLLRENEQPNENHRAFAMPYIVDAAGQIPGLRIHTFQKVANYNTVNLNVNKPHALTMGAAVDYRQSNQIFNAAKGYSVQAATDLGVTLEWVRARCFVNFYHVIMKD